KADASRTRASKSFCRRSLRPGSAGAACRRKLPRAKAACRRAGASVLLSCLAHSFSDLPRKAASWPWATWTKPITLPNSRLPTNHNRFMSPLPASLLGLKFELRQTLRLPRLTYQVRDHRTYPIPPTGRTPFCGRTVHFLRRGGVRVVTDMRQG